MNNALLNIAGRTVLGNLWSTSIGGSLIWVNVKPVVDLLANGVTVGELVTAPQFQALVAGVAAIFIRDPAKLPQLLFKS